MAKQQVVRARGRDDRHVESRERGRRVVAERRRVADTIAVAGGEKVHRDEVQAFGRRKRDCQARIVAAIIPGKEAELVAHA